MNAFDDVLDQQEKQQPSPTAQPAAAPANPYDDVLQQQDQARERSLRGSFIEAQDITPERAAENQRLSDLTGLPPAVVHRNFDEISKRLEIDGKPYEQMMRETPALATWLEKPENAAVAKDDLENLGALEWITTAPQRAFAQGMNQLEVARLRTLQMQRPLTQDEKDQLASAKFHMEQGGALGAGNSWFRKAVTGLASQLPIIGGASLQGASRSAYSIPGAFAVGLGAAAVAGTAPLSVPVLFGAGLSAGMLTGATEFTFQAETGLAYDEFLDYRDELGRPMDPQVAKMAAFGAGALNAGLETLGLEVLAKSIPGVEKLTSGVARSAVKQALRSPSVRAALGEAAKTYGETILSETGVEVAQRAVTIMAGELSKSVGEHPLAPGQLEAGNVNLYEQPQVPNADGTVSTVDSRSYDFDGKEVLLPSVTPDGRHLKTDDEIIAEYKKTGRNLGVFSSPEAANAYAQQLHQDYAKGTYAAGHFKRTAGDIASDLASEATNSAIAFSLMVAPGPLLHATLGIHEAQQAQKNVAFFKALGDGITNSKTAQRQPAAVQKFLEHATKDGPIETLYAPVDTWQTYWQSKGVDPAEMAAELTGNPSAFEEAKATGVDLEIPTAAYAVKLAATEHNAELSQELRLGPDAMNAREAKEFIAAQEAAAAEEKQRETPIKDQVLQQLQVALEGSGVKLPPMALERYAEAVHSVVGTVAQREGLDPIELFKAYGFDVLGPQEVDQARAAQTATESVAANEENIAHQDKPVSFVDLATAANVAAGKELINLEDIDTAAARLRLAGFDVGDIAPPIEPTDATGAVSDARPATSETSFTAERQRQQILEMSKDPSARAGARAMMRRLGEINANRIEEPDNLKRRRESDVVPEAKALLDEKYPPGTAEREEFLRLHSDADPTNRDELLQTAFNQQVTDDGVEYFQSVAPAFYSRLLLAVEQAKTQKATGAQWKATIKNAKTGINADEYALTQVDDLEDGKSYLRDDVLNYLQTHRVEVGQVVLGEPRAPGDEPAGPREPTPAQEREIEERAQEIYDEMRDEAERDALNNWEGPYIRAEREVIDDEIEQEVVDENGDPVLDANGHQTYEYVTEERTVWRAVAVIDGEEIATHDDYFDTEQEAEDVRDTRWFERIDEREREHFFEYFEPDISWAEAEEQARREVMGDDEDDTSNDTHYETYTERGFKHEDSYREAFVTAPTYNPPASVAAELKAARARADELMDAYQAARNAVTAATYSDDQPGDAEMSRLAAARDAAYSALNANNEVIAALQDKAAGVWTDGHGAYNHVQRPIVRLRFNGRSGYSFEDLTAGPPNQPSLPGVVVPPNTERPVRMAHGELEARGIPTKRVLFLEEIQPPQPQNFAVMPPLFQKNWREIGFKWALRWAAEHDYDVVAWTTGKQQDDRYSLSKEVNEIKWSPSPETEDPSVSVMIDTKNSGPIAILVDQASGAIRSSRGHASQWVGEHLSAVVGSEIAKQILEAKSGRIADEGLKVGGIGLARLYDVDFPNVVKNLPVVKKGKGKLGRYSLGIHFGDRGYTVHNQRTYIGHEAWFAIRVNEHGTINARGFDTEAGALEQRQSWIDYGYTDPIAIEQNPEGAGNDYYATHYYVDNPAGRTDRTGFESELEAQRYADVRNADAIKEGWKQLQPGIEITPEMKEAILGGQVLFQDEPGVTKRGSIRRFGPGRKATIKLFKDADVSTFMHEGAHLFLDMLLDLEQRPGASETLRNDMVTLRNWFFGPGGQGPISVREHEQFARGFERYLMEGKAPSVELRGLFNQFRAWLTKLYRTFQALNVNLTNDVRQVFDRMLASDQAIADAQSEFTTTPMFTTAEQAGMDAEEFGRYQKAVADASRKARETLEAKLLQEARRAQSAAYRAQADDVRDEVTPLVQQQPVYQALAGMRYGTRADGSPLVAEQPSEPLKLSRALLVELIGEEAVKRLPRPAIYSVEGGLDPDVVGQLFGFSSGDAMIKAIQAAPSMNAAIEQEVDRRMKERFGDLTLPDKLSAEAKAALANDNRDEIVRRELRALNALKRQAAPFVAAGEKAVADEKRERDYERRWFEAEARLRIAIAEGYKQTQIDALEKEVRRLRSQARGGAVTLRAGIPDDSTLREAAQARIGRTRVRDLRPATFWTAARRASQDATEKAARQDFDGAITAKQSELINLALYKEASRALQDVEKRVRRAQALATPAARARLGKAGADYLDQVDGILDRYDFARASQKVLDRRQALRVWVAQLQRDGMPVDIPEEVLDDARRANYRELPYNELVDVTNAIQQIAHLAAKKNGFFAKQRQRELQAVVDDVEQTVREHATQRSINRFATHLPAEEGSRIIQGMVASHYKLANIVRAMDGYEDGGPVWTAIMLPLNEAGDREAVMNAAATKAVGALVADSYRGRDKLDLYKKRLEPALGVSVPKMAKLMMALNWGNADNRQRLMSGHHLDETQVRAVLDTLDERDWKFVQGVFDHIESYWPEIAAKQKRVTGLEPEKVEALEIPTKFGTFRGGYFPLKYDDRLSARAGANEEASVATLAKQAAYVQATTRRGHTLARLENVKNLPVRLDFGVITEHLTQVIHDLTHHEALVDVSRVLGNRAVQDAIYDTYGDIVYKQMRTALRDVAQGAAPAATAFDGVMNHIRVGSTVASLGWNMTTVAMQPLGLTQSMVRIGPKWVARGMGRWLKDAATMQNTVAWINERSDFMRMRGQTQQREINEVRNQIGLSTGKLQGWVEEILSKVTADKVQQLEIADSYFYFIQQSQRIADVPTWLGQYEKSMAAGETEERAIHIADQAVLDAQGGGQIKDLASVQRGNVWLKLWTNFYSFFNVTFNLTAESLGKNKFTTPGGVGRLAVDYLLLYAVPATLGFFLRAALKGEPPDDDRELAKKLAQENIAYMTSILLGAREAAGMIQGNFGWEGPAGARAFAALSKFTQQAKQGELDKAFWRSLNDVGGILFHYPAGQVRRTLEGMRAIIEGETANPGVLVAGPPAEKK